MTDKGAITRAIEFIRQIENDGYSAINKVLGENVAGKIADDLQSLKDAVPDNIEFSICETKPQFWKRVRARNEKCARLLTDAVKG